MASVIFVDDITVDESQAFVDVTVRLDLPSTETISVRLDTNDITAQSGRDDYVGIFAGSLSFLPGETTKTVRLAIGRDLEREGSEDFALVLSRPVNATIADGAARITIVDNDSAAGTPLLRVSSMVVDEAQGQARFVVTLDRPGAGNVSFNYATQDGTATAGQDYTAVQGSFTLAPGETARTVVVPLLNDTAAEGNETFSLVLSGLGNATSLQPYGTATIWANDGPTISQPVLYVDDVTVDESRTHAEVVVRLSAPSTSVVSARLDTDDVTAQSGRDDYIGIFAGSVYFAPGETVKTVLLPIGNDLEAEARESFLLVVSRPVNATIGDGTGRVTVVDNDAASGTPILKVDSLVVDESQKEARFVITLDRPGAGNVSFSYATQDGSAAAGSDYTAVQGSFTLAPGETTRTVVVPLLDDFSAEGNETFSLVLSNLGNATSLEPWGTATIWANDGPIVSQPRLYIDDVTIDESSGFADVVVRLSAPSNSVVSARVDTDDHTAQSGRSDYIGIFAGSVYFAPGETARTIRLPIGNDVEAEAPESFYVNLSRPVNATIGDGTALVTIIDNDAASGTPVLRVSSMVVDESHKEARFVVTLDRPGAGNVGFNYTTQNGSAVAGQDYTAVQGSFTLAPGETTRTVVVPLIDDTAAEGNETFSLLLTGLVNATAPEPTGTATIWANDGPLVSQPAIFVDDVSVGEGGSFADVVVRLSAPSTSEVSMRLDTDDGTAQSSRDDYIGIFAGSAYFAPGETVRVVRLGVRQDLLVEDPETFRLVASRPVNATLGDATGIITIVDDDGTPSAGATFTGTDAPETLTASSGNDKLFGLGGNDTLLGLGGDDLLDGGLGNDALDGGTGTDTASYKNASGPVTANLATGQASGADGNDTFTSIENLEGSRFADTLSGDANGNVIDGGAGADKMAGGRGADTYYVDDAGDVVTELDNAEAGAPGPNLPLDLGGAIDKVIASVSYTLTNFVENLDLAAGASHLDGTGNALDNVLAGNGGNNALKGLEGNDRLTGGGGNDTLDGGDGLDTAVYGGPLANYRLQKVGTGWTVTDDTGVEGTDTLRGIEVLEFAGKTLQLANLPLSGTPAIGLSGTFLFDAVYYLANHSELVPTLGLATAAQHYLTTGAAAGFLPNAYFDATYYKNKWADLTPLNLDNATLFQHFNLFGVWEGRAPGPLFDKFDGNQYLTANPDVAGYVDASIADFLGSRTNGAIAHFIIYGAAEGRPAVDLQGQPVRLDYSVDFG